MAYRIAYSDYPGTAVGPPDPERWVGPPGPTGPMGPQGVPGPPGPNFPEAPADGAIYGRGGATPAWTPTLPLTGGTMTGLLVLSGDPSAALGAASKQYVDGAVNRAGGPFLPLATGGTVSGATTLGAGGTLTGTFGGSPTWTGTHTFTAAPAIHVSGAAGAFRTIRLETSGVARFSFGLDNSTETGTNNAGSSFVMSSFNDAGTALNNNLISINRNTGRLTLSTGFTVNGTMGAGFAPGNTNGLWQQCSFSGSASQAALAGFNQWTVNSDTMAYTGQGLFLDGIFYNFGGAGFSGNRGGQYIVMTQTGPCTGLSGSGGIVAAQYGVLINNTLGGSAGANAGGIFGLNIYNRLTAGASNVVGSVGMEIDIESASGSSYSYQTGIQVVATTAHKQPAGVFSCGYVIGGQTSSIGMDYGLYASSWALQSGSTLLMTDWAGDNPTFSVNRGIDLRALTCGNEVIAAQNFAVGPTGRVRVGSGYLDYNASGAILDAAGAVCTAGTLTASVSTAYPADGNNYFVEDPYGGVWRVTLLSGATSITAITMVLAPVVKGAPPANPVTLTPRGGLKRFVPAAITANLTWDTSRTTLSLNPSGGQVTAPTPAPGNSTTQVATTAFVAAGIASLAAIPLSLTTAGAASVTGTTSETNLASFRIPANTIGKNGVVEIKLLFTYTNSANNKIISMRLGVSSGVVGTQVASFAVTTSLTTQAMWILRANNATNAQVMYAGSPNQPFGSGAGGFATGAADTTLDTYINIDGTLANSGETITLQHAIVTVYPHAN